MERIKWYYTAIEDIGVNSLFYTHMFPCFLALATERAVEQWHSSPNKHSYTPDLDF